MPQYQYQCPSCNTKIVIDKPIKNLNRKEFCSKCSRQMIRVPSASNFVLKGNGWTPKYHKG
jgi:putative FmdB family regulatory protein